MSDDEKIQAASFEVAPPRIKPNMSRREWERLADGVETIDVEPGKVRVDERGGLNVLFITVGPKHYVKRLAARTARERGFVLTDVRRYGRVPNSATGGMNCYIVRFERRQ